MRSERHAWRMYREATADVARLRQAIVDLHNGLTNLMVPVDEATDTLYRTVKASCRKALLREPK